VGNDALDREAGIFRIPFETGFTNHRTGIVTMPRLERAKSLYTCDGVLSTPLRHGGAPNEVRRIRRT
jgi:hypothetical protein